MVFRKKSTNYKIEIIKSEGARSVTLRTFSNFFQFEITNFKQKLRRTNLILSLRSMLQHFIVIQRNKCNASQDIQMLRCPEVRSIETCDYLEMCPTRNE
jgi:hypothetical protein